MEIREFLFSPLRNKKFNFAISAKEKGIFSGEKLLIEQAEKLQLDIDWVMPEGTAFLPGDAVFKGAGEAEKVARAEEMLMGIVGKSSGVATKAKIFVDNASGRIKIVCGAWKKVQPEVRGPLRLAISTGGAGIRITDRPFIYLDKNYVRMFGGVASAVQRARQFEEGRSVAVQIKGEIKPLLIEAKEAVDNGADIIMVDTGNISDLSAVTEFAVNDGWRSKVQIAFAGGISLEQLPAVIAAGADIVDVGRFIIDAPLIDLSLDIT